jgi:flagellar basal body-associated protein FliL
MPDPQVSPTPRNWKKLGLLAVVLALVLGAGCVFFFWLRPLHPTSAAPSSSVQSTLALETFVVNLSGSGERAYLRVGISLGLSHALGREKDEVPMALVRDTVLSVLSSAQPAQLLQAEGKRQLKAELLYALQERVPQLGVEDVYFTEFLVQM